MYSVQTLEVSVVEEEILPVNGKAILSQWVVWLYQENPSWDSVELALLMRSTCDSANLSGQHVCSTSVQPRYIRYSQ